jgi:hypothetical protein
MAVGSLGRAFERGGVGQRQLVVDVEEGFVASIVGCGYGSPGGFAVVEFGPAGGDG